jgi:(p)ppGpp synthase/HD superfamily hydrolase
MNNWSQEVYITAWNYASTQHRGQTYRGPQNGEQVDYLNHIGMVTTEVMHCLQHTDQSYDADLAVQCAILHDSIEDTSSTYEDIQNLFGKGVADGVMALTKDETLPSKTEMMVHSLERIKAQPHEIWMVKVADRISNLYSPPFYWEDHKIAKYAEEAELIYDALAPSNELLAKRLRAKIDAYPSFMKSNN